MSTDVKLKYGDIEFYGGEPVLIQDTNKLEQDVGKILITEKNSPFHPDYGCDLYDLIGNYEKDDVLDVLVRKHVVDALNYYSQIQYRQGLQQSQTLPEILAKIDSVSAYKIPDQPGSYFLKVNIKDGTASNISIQFTVQG